MICPACDGEVTELIEHPKLDELVCYWCAREFLGLNQLQAKEENQ